MAEILPCIPPCVIGFPVTQACALISLYPVTLQESYYKILVTVMQSITNVPQMNNRSTSGMNEE